MTLFRMSKIHETVDFMKLRASHVNSTSKVWIVVDAVRRCPTAAPGREAGTGQIAAGQCPPVICPSLSACVSPYRSSPLYKSVQTQRRHNSEGQDSEQGNSTDAQDALESDDEMVSAFGRPAGPLRLRHLEETDEAVSDDSLLVRGMGPSKDGKILPINVLGASTVQDRRPETGRRAFAEEAFYVEFRIVGHRSSIVQEALKYLTCRSR